MKFILQTGGQGTKLWPLSRESFPKQFQKIVNGTSLFSYQVKTLLKAYSPEDLFVSTKERYVELSQEQAPEIPKENYIVEPDAKRGRGPAEGLVFVTMQLWYPDDPFMLVQTDDLRQPEEKYLEMLAEMEKLARRDKKFISGGQKATFPVLGVDYLQLGNKIKMSTPLNIFEVENFIERNNDFYATKKLVQDFYVATHTGHICWYPDPMLAAYKKHRPDWYASLMEIKKVLQTSEAADLPVGRVSASAATKISKIYSSMEEGTTEGEVLKHVFPTGYIVLLPYEWTDIGTWNSVYEFLGKKGANYESGTVVSVDSKGSVVKSTNPEKLVALLGVDDMVVVDTPDILLVVPRDKSDKIKEIHKAIKEKGLERFL
jgi:mannose-1-phosphate guanylyltransferase